MYWADLGWTLQQSSMSRLDLASYTILGAKSSAAGLTGDSRLERIVLEATIMANKFDWLIGRPQMPLWRSSIRS